MNKELIDSVRTVLEFYKELGFERLPIFFDTETRRHGERNFQIHWSIGSPGHRVTTSKEAALNALREEIGDCKRCKLSKGRTNIVFGEGSPDAVLMFIGEAPGREEDLQGRPFVGDAGQLLTKLIGKMGFRREDVYIGNIVKCRPPLNRDPEDDEIATCMTFIERQVDIISPKVIMSLGRISAQSLISTKVPISKLRGKFYQYKGVPLMPTFHPAYLLRNPKDKWLVWEDAQKVLERLKKTVTSNE